MLQRGWIYQASWELAGPLVLSLLLPLPLCLLPVEEEAAVLLGRQAAEAEEVLQPLSLCLLPVEEEAAVLLVREAAEAVGSSTVGTLAIVCRVAGLGQCPARVPARHGCAAWLGWGQCPARGPA